MLPVNRRIVLAAGATAALTSVEGAEAAPSRRRSVTVRRGVNLSVTAAPDGRIAFDLLGVLWVVPPGGGQARRLTDDFEDIAQPDWSPDGRWIAFQSYRSGNYQIARVAPDGGGVEQLTSGPFDCREARWSPDGRSIVFTTDRTGRYALHVLDVETREIRALGTGEGEESEPAWSPDGQSILYVADRAKLMQLRIGGGAPVLLREVPRPTDWLVPSEMRGPSWTRDGQPLHYEIRDGAVRLLAGDRVLIEGEDLAPLRACALPDGRLLHACDGELRVFDGQTSRTVPFHAQVSVAAPRYRRAVRDFTSQEDRPVLGISSPMLSPDGRRIVFGALNDIYVLEIDGPHRRLISDASFKSHPCWSPDGESIAYACDRSGKFEIWLHQLATGAERQLTTIQEAALSPVWSPDGATIAFLDNFGRLQSVDVATGATKREYDRLIEPGRPSFGPDGRIIALAAMKPYARRFREGINEILVIDRATATGVYAPIAPHRSIATRGDDGPVWSPDGRHFAYVMGSTLWVVPADGRGRLTGPPRQLTQEVSDAPSWSGDSQTLLYLSGGQLRLVSASGGAPRTVALNLRWANAVPPSRTIIRAGRMWDGVARGYRERVDIEIVGNRIASIRDAHGETPSDVTFVDAAQRTVLPGLIDMHTHRQTMHYAPGARQGPFWLSMGVTATRSVGGPAYHATADREALDSGARLGPRHFASGEAIDGSRVFYGFMRPVTEDGQLALEIERARALRYDMLKAYVRLPFEQQAELIEAAHAQGMPVSSHYHFPSLGLGIDGMEHLGATTRLGYSRTLQPYGGEQEDVTALFAAARAQRTTTLFASMILLLEDRSLVDDRRVRTLYMPWELEDLDARVALLATMHRRTAMRILERQVGQVRASMESGGRVLCGTDAPIDLPGVSLHLNLRAMTRFGISPRDALQTATSFAGDALGGQVGVLARGRLADMIVVDGDPLADVADASKIERVMLNGAPHSVDALLAPFARCNAEAPPHTHDAHESYDRAYWWHAPEYVAAALRQCCAGHL